MMENTEIADKGNHFLSQHIITQAFQDQEMKKAIIQFEFKLVQLYAHKLGIIVLPNENNLYEWHGLISVAAGLYAPGKFKFILIFPLQFPLQKPSIKFSQAILHPLVNQNGQVDVDKLMPEWKYGQECMLYNLLSRFCDMFLDVQYFETRDSFNPEASDMYRTNFKQFIDRIKEQINESQQKLYEEDSQLILKFTKPNPTIINLLSKVEEINETKSLTFQEKKRLLIKHIFESNK